MNWFFVLNLSSTFLFWHVACSHFSLFIVREIEQEVMDSDTPQKPEPYKPGPAALEYFAELKRLENRGPIKPPPAKKRRKPRRKNPQRKIKNYFKDATNEDGYPLKHCEYEPEEGKMVYRPPNYGDEYDSRLPRHHCECCHLKPCILVVHGKGASDACFQLDRKDDSASAEKIVAEGEKFFMRKYCKYMKIRYSKKVPIPDCAQDRIDDFLYEWRLDKEDSSDEDSDGSEEENEFVYDQVVNHQEEESGDEDGGDDGGEHEFEDDLAVTEQENHDPRPVDNREGANTRTGPDDQGGPPHERDDDPNEEAACLKGLFTQPFHGDPYSDDEDECQKTENAFIDGAYIPKSLLRDRDVGDPPIEHVVEAHRKRILNQRRTADERRQAGMCGGAVDATVGGRKRAKSHPPKGKRKWRKARTSTGSFFVDHVSGLESDSDGEELMMLVKERRRRTSEAFAALRRCMAPYDSQCTKHNCVCWKKEGTDFNRELEVVYRDTRKLVECDCQYRCRCSDCIPS